MLFTVIPQDIFYPVVQHRTPKMRCSSHNPDLELLRRLGLAPVLMTPDGCCQAQVSRECCRNPSPETTGCCKEPVSTKPEKEQTTVEKSTLDFRGFSPEQITAKVIDKCLIVRGEQKNEHTNVQVTKSIPLPEGVDNQNIACRFEDGFVTVHIPVTQQRLKKLEKSSEKPSGKHEEREEQSDMDKRRKAELERSLKILSDLFSVLSGLQLDESDAKSRVENGNEACDTEKCEEHKCENKKCEDEKYAMDKNDWEKREDGKREEKREEEKSDEGNHAREKHGEELEKKSKESLEENYSKESSVAVESSQSTNPVTSTPAGEEHAKGKSDCGDELTTGEEEGFVHLEKQEADDKCVDEFRGSDEDGVITSLNDYVNENNDEDDKSTGAYETEMSEPKQPNVFKLEFKLSSYNPEQVRVVFKDGDVIIEAEREIVGENYSETECVTRHIRVPENVDESMLKSFLSEEGLLTVQAPYKIADKSTLRAINAHPED